MIVKNAVWLIFHVKNVQVVIYHRQIKNTIIIVHFALLTYFQMTQNKLKQEVQKN